MDNPNKRFVDVTMRQHEFDNLNRAIEDTVQGCNFFELIEADPVHAYIALENYNHYGLDQPETPPMVPIQPTDIVVTLLRRRSFGEWLHREEPTRIKSIFSFSIDPISTM